MRKMDDLQVQHRAMRLFFEARAEEKRSRKLVYKVRNKLVLKDVDFVAELYDKVSGNSVIFGSKIWFSTI